MAKRCGIEPLQVDEVIGYYSMLHRKPHGQISCAGLHQYQLPDHGRRRTLRARQQKLGIGNKEVTPDGLFSLEEVECMGACSWAPAIQVNYDFHHFVTPEKLNQLLDDLRKAQ